MNVVVQEEDNESNSIDCEADGDRNTELSVSLEAKSHLHVPQNPANECIPEQFRICQEQDANDGSANSSEEGSFIYSTPDFTTSTSKARKQKRRKKESKFAKSQKKKRKKTRRKLRFSGSLSPRLRRTATVSSGPPWTRRYHNILQDKEGTPRCAGRKRPKPPLPCTKSNFFFTRPRKKIIR